ncbi:30S ribosomal protein S3 [Nanohaloarchaea archaeon]|nr:30S ribosomal protein S3 [Candidatus Nanohaloarchaea archaeon]
MQEKQFVQQGIRRVNLDDFLADELEGSGYAGSTIERTPTSTKIVITAEKPGLIIGRGGSRIRELTSDVEDEFGFEDPQIEVNEIEEPDSNAQVVANNMAEWLEKGGSAKRVGYTYLRRVRETGVIGAQIEVSGKLSGNRGRTEKFSFGYVKRCGDTADEQVDRGYRLARTKPGAIGVKVRIMESMPEFMHQDTDLAERIRHESEEGTEDDRADKINRIIEEAENMTGAEIGRAIEQLEDVQEAEIEVDEVRDVYENHDTEDGETGDSTEDGDGQDDAEPETTADEPEQTEAADADYNAIVSGTIADAKDELDALEEPDYEAALEAESSDKDRVTFVEWLEERSE